jgi:competence protein ComEA
MEPFPAEWRTVGGSEPRGAAVTPDRGTEKHGRGPAAIERNHGLIVLVTAAAVAAGMVALAGTLWLTTPHGQVGISAHAAAPGGNGAAGFQGLVVRGTPAPAFASSAPIDRPAEIVVDVEGAVRHPGIQRLAAGSRVGDAIAAAGGYGDRADVVAAAQTINLAEALQDGAKVRVPTLGETAAAGPTSGAAASPPPGAGALIDLNHADEGQLESLPGVGPVTAGKIIDARTTAAFASVDDLGTRSVVGPSTLEKLRPLVTVTP